MSTSCSFFPEEMPARKDGGRDIQFLASIPMPTSTAKASAGFHLPNSILSPPTSMTDTTKYAPLPTYEEAVPPEFTPSPSPTMARRTSSQRLLRIVFLAVAATLLVKGLFLTYSRCMLNMRSHTQSSQIHPAHEPLFWPDELASSTSHSPVQLEAHIMSKCPDAKDCLEQLILPTMQQVHSHVNFTLSFLGTVDPHSDAISCMHGPGECLGDMIILCAAKLYPDPKIYLGYANCLISNYQSIPERELVEGCALEHGVDFQRVNSCISDDGGEGVGLLRESVERSREEGVIKSCTVRVNGKIRCIRDGGRWKDCGGGSGVGDLVGDIERLWNGSREGE
jgi:hypothetical protein